MKKVKKTGIRTALSLAAILLFGVFVWNLENLIREFSFGPAYHAQVTTLDYYLEEGMYGELFTEVRRQQTLGQKTYLDRSEYEAFADYYEAALQEQMLKAENGNGQIDAGQTERKQERTKRTEAERKEALEWAEKREAAKSRLTGYRFRKAVEGLEEVFP